MKRNVKLSSYSIVLSGLSLVVFCMLFVNALRRDAPLWMIWSLGIAPFILCFAALCYTPLSVSVDGMNLCIQRPLKTKHIPLADIADVKLVRRLWLHGALWAAADGLAITAGFQSATSAAILHTMARRPTVSSSPSATGVNICSVAMTPRQW